jgi:hypothetical protein
VPLTPATQVAIGVLLTKVRVQTVRVQLLPALALTVQDCGVTMSKASLLQPQLAGGRGFEASVTTLLLQVVVT